MIIRTKFWELLNQKTQRWWAKKKVLTFKRWRTKTKIDMGTSEQLQKKVGQT